jgi:outer membrane protein assembly factor BamB
MRSLSRISHPLLLILASLLIVQPVRAQVDVLTQHNDNARSGANLKETKLNITNVNKNTFGKLVYHIVDGNPYAQPLIVSQAKIAARPGTATNVAIVATEHNSVYAFDAEDTTQYPDQGPDKAVLWETQQDVLGTPIGYVENNQRIGAACTDLTIEIGITGTPVISLTKQTPPKEGVIFVVAKSKSGGQYVYKLFALNLADGARMSDVTIEGEVNGTGFGASGSSGSKKIHFDPVLELNRPALLLHNNVLYIAFGGRCDAPLGEHSYHGWLFAYDVSDPKAPKLADVFCTTPNGRGGTYEGRAGIWMSGQGPAVDDTGNIYFVTGDGTNNGTTDFGNSVVKLKAASGKLQIQDWYAPKNREVLKTVDVDLGSAGVVLVPNSHLLVTGGKEGRMYLIDRDNMGRGAKIALDSFQVTHDPIFPPPPLAPGGHQYNIHGTPIIWVRHDSTFVYVNGEEDPLKQFELIPATGPGSGGWKFASHTAFAVSTETAPYPNFPQGEFGLGMKRDPVWMPGGFLSLSADGTSEATQRETGIIWVTMPYSDNANLTVVRGVLRAFNASNVSMTELWDSENTGSDKDRFGQFAKFSPPTVANGKVYVGTFQQEMMNEQGFRVPRMGGDKPALAIYGLK